MTMQPANVAKATQQIIKSGIAHRMLVESHQSHLPNDPSGCKFWVEVYKDEDDGKESQSVIVETPGGKRQAFRADPGVTFGVYEQKPLSKSQQAVVNRLAREWKQRNQPTSV